MGGNVGTHISYILHIFYAYVSSVLDIFFRFRVPPAYFKVIVFNKIDYKKKNLVNLY